MIEKIPSHLVAVILFGALSQVGQVLLLRELFMVFHGNEISMGFILASWMAWVGAGSFLGGFFVTSQKKALLLPALSSIGILLALPTTILLIRRLRGLFHVLPGAYLTLSEMAISSLLLMAPTCLLLGAQFVFLSRVWRGREEIHDTSCGGKTYIFEATGNMLGGMLFSLFLVQYLPSLQIIVSANALLLLAILYINYGEEREEKKLPQRIYQAMALALLFSILSLPFLGPLDEWGYRIMWQRFAPNHQLVEVIQSKHGMISILKSEDQYSFYQSGHLLFSIAGQKTQDPSLEELEAITFAHLSLLQHEKPSSLLLIGGGLRGYLTQFIKYPLERIDYIELDPLLIKGARPYLSSKTLEALEDPRIHILHTDGRLFVKEAEEKYDIIIIDTPDPFTAALNRFYTKEFFQECEALLRPNGVLVLHALSTPNLLGLGVANRNATIYHTLSSVFSHVLAAGEGTLFYLASHDREQVTLDVAALERRFIEQGVETELFSPHHFRSLFITSQIQRVNYILHNHGRSPKAHLQGPKDIPLFFGLFDEEEKREEELLPAHEERFINRDIRPIAYYYTLMFWHAMTHGSDNKALLHLLRIETFWLSPLLAIPLFIVFLKKRRRRERASSHTLGVLWTALTTGLSTMALQISLLFSFQSIYGFIYEVMGLIVAIFMGGLALGASLALPYSRERSSIRSLAYAQLAMALLAGLIGALLPLIQSISSPPLLFFSFSLLTFLAGLLNGVDFPLACACYMGIKGRADQTTGIIYGVELIGACIGAVISSVVIIPILGISASCFLGGFASLTAFIVLLL